MLTVLGIDEEIEDILPTELISMNRKGKLRIFEELNDFRVTTKSGKIIIFEFKKNTLRKNDLKQVYNYYRHTYCKEKTDVMAIIIVISKEGKIKEYQELDITYHPRIIKTKKINKQEDLKTIRNKFEHNIMLTPMECSLIVTLPLFELKESESQIVEEMCEKIHKKNVCIPEEKLDEITMGMYLNILEYIDVEKQEELMEMIDMAAKTEGMIAKMKREERDKGIEEGKAEGIKEGIKEGKTKGVIQGQKNIILELLKNNTLNEVSSMINKDESEIRKIVGID